VRFRGGCGALARVARTIASTCAALCALAPAVVSARDVIGRRDVRLEWAAPSGEVGAYVVFVSRDGGPYRSEQYTLEPRAQVGGRVGETVQVRVRAYAVASGRTLSSAPSEPSEAIRFLPAGPATSAVSAPPPSVAPPAAGLPDPRSAPPAPFGPPLVIQAGGDFDGDGDLDLLATLGSWEHPLALFLKDGSLDHLACLAPFAADSAAFAADFDGDGRDELAVQSGDAVSLLRLDLPGAMTLLRREAVPAGARVLPADLDGDHSASLVIYEPASGRLTERAAQGQAIDFGAIRPLYALHAGDFDGDGRDDLWVQARSGGAAELWLMREGGTFEVAPVRFDGSVATAAAVDWNGDGRDDLAGWDATRGELRAWLLDGARVIDRRALGRGPVEALRALDLDGNGRDDLLVAAPGGASRAVLSTP
jgi:FG-GAP-like repeat/FG-GAP repeat